MSRYNLAASAVPLLFTGDRHISRILTNRTLKPLSTVSEGRLVTTVEGERILAVDIAWALQYGNWPKYPLVQLDEDPFNCAVLINVFPARLKRLRYRETVRGDGLYYHPLSRTGHHSSARCRKDWEWKARDQYEQDLPNVLRIEQEERDLRHNSHAPAPALPARLLARVEKVEPKPPAAKRTPIPPAVEGMEHHWYQGEWVTVPVACHVADDHIRRIERWLAGAVRFVYQPLAGEVWGFRADGSVVE